MTTWFVVLLPTVNPHGTLFDFVITSDPIPVTSNVTEVDAAVLTTSLSNDFSDVKNNLIIKNIFCFCR